MSLEWQVTRRLSEAGDPDREIPAPLARAIFAEAASLGAERALFSGGDPAARGDLAELVALGTAAGLGVHVAAPAHPQRLARRLPELLSARLAGITAALHGPDGKSHDAASGPGSFTATVDFVQSAREKGLSMEVRTSLLPGRLRTLPKMAQLVAAIGADRWTVIAPIEASSPTAHAAGSAPVGLGALALERALVTLADLVAAHRFEVVTIAAPHLARVVRMRHGGSPGGPAGRVHVDREGARLFIAPNGEIWPSAELPIPIGSVHIQHSLLPRAAAERTAIEPDASSTGDAPGPAAVSPLATALAHPLLDELSSGERLTGKCGICSFQKVCGGSRARAFATHGDVWAEDPSCAYVPKAARKPGP